MNVNNWNSVLLYHLQFASEYILLNHLHFTSKKLKHSEAASISKNYYDIIQGKIRMPNQLFSRNVGGQMVVVDRSGSYVRKKMHLW